MAVDVEPAAPPSGTDHDGTDGGGPARPAARRRWSSTRIATAVAALAVLGALAVFAVGSDEESASDDTAQDESAPSPSGELDDGYVVFSDPETGISLAHPETWVPLARADGSLRLLLGAGGDSSLLVRVEPIDGTVNTPEELTQVQAATDRIAGAPGVQVVNREAVEVNGMLGIFYLARFTDEASGTKVANAHYFLFKGNTMHVVLFQAVPEEEFERLAPEFDKVLASFQGAPVEEGSE